jgi:hypothetical protein
VRGVLFLGMALVAAGLSLIVSWSTQAQTVNRAGLVVQFGDGSVQTYCIQFTSPSITGYDLLQATGNLQVVYDTANSGFGAGVCKINNDGCNYPLQDCFCQCQGINCVYWSYFHLNANNSFDYSTVGASSHTLQNGSVDGWRWGTGSTTTAPPPPVYTFDQLCSTTGTATSTPTPSPTTSGTPSVTPTRTQTPTPTFTPGVVQIQLAANPTTLTAGQCAIVNWRVTGPWTAIFLDNAIVQPEEQRQICPSQTQTLTLRAEYAGGAETRNVTLQVTGAVPPTAAATTPFVSPTTPPPPATTQVPLPTTPAAVGSPTSTLATATLSASPTAGLATATVPGNDVTATATSLPTATAVASNTPDSRLALEPGVPAEPDTAPSSTETTGEPAEDVSLLLLQYALFIVILGLLGAAGVFLLWRRSRVNDE